MTTRKTATGKIQVKTWESLPFDTSTGPSLNELRVTEDFVGDIAGEGAARMLQTLRADGSASFVAVERVVGTLDGRSGSFVLQDEGTLAGNRVKGTWFVVAGSGTGELAGLRGEGGFEAELGQHADYTLTYWFE
jgi:hypothetical protein